VTGADKRKLQEKLDTIVLGGGTLQVAGRGATSSDLLPRLACLEGQWLELILEDLREIISEMDFRTIPTAYIPEDEGYLPTVNFTFDEECDVRIDTSWPL
jgi:hypothetical protein